MRNIFFFINILVISTIFAQKNRIVLDENFDDWREVEISYSDPIGDQASGIIDFQNIWITNDERYLYISLETGGEIDFDDSNYITMYVDVDNNSNSGYGFAGIGAEIEYQMGKVYDGETIRKYWSDGESTDIKHSVIGLVSSPTVTNTRFEFILNLESKFDGRQIFSSNAIRIVFKDKGTGADQLPDGNGGVFYTLKNDPAGELPTFSIKKENQKYLRVLSYNVERDAFFDSDKFDAYSRILTAVDPDIIAFQEIYNHTSRETIDRIEEMFPSIGERKWYHSKIGYDLIIASRFPIKSNLNVGPPNDGQKSAAHLIDLRPKYDSDLLLLNAHPKCCGGEQNEIRRQNQVDAQMAFVRNSKETGGELTIPEGTPIIIVGDMNFVGRRSQQTTLVTGDISDNSTYGPDFNPDWNGESFIDSKVNSTNLPATWTWHNAESDYAPGRLDYIVFTGSVLDMVNGYSLVSAKLTEDELAEALLNHDDVRAASDHNPLVADFELKGVTDIKESSIIPNEFRLEQNFPNPFNPTTTIEYSFLSKVKGKRSNVELKIYDLLGNDLATLVSKPQMQGVYNVLWNAEKISSGVYYYQLKIDHFSETKKMILMK